MKINKHDTVHMTKMANMSIYGINLVKIFFSGTSGGDFEESRYKASGTQAYYILFK